MDEEPVYGMIEKQMETIKIVEENYSPVLFKTMQYDFQKQENKRQQIYISLAEKLNTINNNSKRRPREEDELINPFLKLVKITSN